LKTEEQFGTIKIRVKKLIEKYMENLKESFEKFCNNLPKQEPIFYFGVETIKLWDKAIAPYINNQSKGLTNKTKPKRKRK
jgi:hypothetical protein